MTISWTDRHGTSHKFQEDAMELIQQAECLGCQVQSSPSQVGAEQTQDWGGTNWGNRTYLISNKIFKDSNGATTLFLPFCTKQVILLNCSLWKRSLEQTFFCSSKFMKDLGVLGSVFSKESLEILTDEFLFIQDTLWLHNFLPNEAAGPCLSLWQRLVGRVAVLWQVWDAVDLRPGKMSKNNRC